MYLHTYLLELGVSRSPPPPHPPERRDPGYVSDMNVGAACTGRISAVPDL